MWEYGSGSQCVNSVQILAFIVQTLDSVSSGVIDMATAQNATQTAVKHMPLVDGVSVVEVGSLLSSSIYVPVLILASGFVPHFELFWEHLGVRKMEGTYREVYIR